jgi:polyhydroxybutyrate depolymerase
MTRLERHLRTVTLAVLSAAVCAAGVRVAEVHIGSEVAARTLAPYAMPTAQPAPVPTTARPAPPVTAPTPAPTAVPRPVPTPQPLPASTPPVTTVGSISVGGGVRQWVQVSPAHGTGASTPILVVLHGSSETASAEIQRDGLTPLVAQGRAELVYPQGIGNSWNAGGCCGAAAAQNVDDVGFLRALVARVDPGHARPIHLVGYSNGGRLAYTVACDLPGLVDTFSVVAAVPVRSCAIGRPISVLQVDGTADPEIPYQPGDRGTVPTAETTRVATLRSLDACPAAPATVTRGSLTLQTWSGCRAGTRVAFATYRGGDHGWPPGNATTPSAAATIWGFVSGAAPW